MVRDARSFCFRKSVFRPHRVDGLWKTRGIVLPCLCLRTQCHDVTVGPRAIMLCADLTTGEFIRLRIGERQVPHLLQYFSSDHNDEGNGRKWNADAKATLVQFLGAATAVRILSRAEDFRWQVVTCV